MSKNVMQNPPNPIILLNINQGVQNQQMETFNSFNILQNLENMNEMLIPKPHMEYVNQTLIQAYDTQQVPNRQLIIYNTDQEEQQVEKIESGTIQQK